MMNKKTAYPVGSLTIAGTPVSEYVIVSTGGEHVGEAARMLAEYLEKGIVK